MNTTHIRARISMRDPVFESLKKELSENVYELRTVRLNLRKQDAIEICQILAGPYFVLSTV